MSPAGILLLPVKIGTLFRAEAAGSRFRARMPESAAQPTGLKVKDEINATLRKESPAALPDNKIVAKQFLKEALAPSTHHCNRSSQIAGHVSPTRWTNVGCIFRSPTTSTMPKYPGAGATKTIGRGRAGGRGCLNV